MSERVPFNRPSAAPAAVGLLEQALASDHWSGNGPFTRRCEEILSEQVGTPALLTSSCTRALELSAQLLDLGPGDEVIVPSFTFVSTANAVAIRGATPVFADIRPDTLNLDEGRLEELITAKTKAVIPVHYAGVGCEMDAIGKIAEPHGIEVIEDNAHGLFGSYKGRPLGSFGRCSAVSFHETKNISCGEGGAIFLREGDRERAEIIRDKGTNRSAFFRGEVDHYSWIEPGSNFLMPDPMAAILQAQLEARAPLQQRRAELWRAYERELGQWASAQGVELPTVPDHCQSTFHLFHLLLPDRERRDAMIEHLDSRGVAAVFHYVPLHLSPLGQRLGGKDGHCPVTEDVSGRLLRLPLYNELDDDQQQTVIEAVLAFDA